MLGLFNDKKTVRKQPTKRTKNPTIAGDALKYQNGSGVPRNQRQYQLWINQISALRNVIGSTAQMASGAKLMLSIEDSKGKKKRFKKDIIDVNFMNNEEDTTQWLYKYFGTLKTFENILIIPESSKGKFRAGKVDFYIQDNVKWSVNADTTGKRTYDKFTIKTSTKDYVYDYDDVIFINKSLTSANPLYGMSRLQSLNEEIARILSMGNFVDSYIGSGGKKSAIIGYEGMISEAQQEGIKDAFNNFLTNPDTKSLLLNAEKLNVNQISDSLAGNDIIGFMTNLNETILESYNLPKWILGDYEGSTNSETVKLGLRVWFEVAIKGELTTLSRHLQRYFRNIMNIKNLVVDFDYSGISLLEDDAKVVLERSSQMFRDGAMSSNEYREAMGLVRLEGEAFDYHLVPANITSGQPVTFENFEADVQAKLDNENTETNPNEDIPSGTGGQNNTEDMRGSE